MKIDSDSKPVSKPMYLDRYTIGSYNPGASIFKQLLWYYLGSPIVRSYFLPITALKVFILRRFGATIGRGVNIKPGVQIKFPWRLSVGHHVWIGENAWIDNVVQVTIDDHVCISQGVYLCTGNHDWRDPNFALQAAPITIASGAWIAAQATIGPGVTVGQGAVLGLGSVTGRSLEPMTIYAGNPAQAIKSRQITDSPSRLAASAKG
jgi:putative colanic acid biosynthesis acetyltransferase WcaF